MAFILKSNPTVLNIKLTNIGRQLLSQGKLHFKKWAVGDSEVDYKFNEEIGLTAFKANIMRPKDAQPKLLSYIKRIDNDSNSIYTEMPTVVSNTNVITNTAKERGFFEINSNGTIKILTDPLHCKQPDVMVYISEVTGGTVLHLKKAPSYLSNISEPVVGDYILVAWANPLVTGGTVSPVVSKSVPYIWYKIQEKISGNLSTNNLKIKVDKPLPNFNGFGGSIASGVFVYPNNNARATSGDSIQTYYSAPYVTDFVENSVIAFLENSIAPTIDVPVWNMAIVFTEDVAGVRNTDRNYTQYFSKLYGGFVNYIERISSNIKKIGIIHFSNSSPSNNYGEGLFSSTPVLELPTIMWHHSEFGEIGLKLHCDGEEKILPNLDTPYHDLIDPRGVVVGKVFNHLKIFVIEDQELLFAMSYKSNRNWTLPKFSVGLNVGLCDMPVCSLTTPTISIVPESYPGANDGSFTITPVGAQGLVLYKLNNGVQYTANNIFNGLEKGDYDVTILDTAVGDCQLTTNISIPRTSELIPVTGTTGGTGNPPPIVYFNVPISLALNSVYGDNGWKAEFQSDTEVVVLDAFKQNSGGITQISRNSVIKVLNNATNINVKVWKYTNGGKPYTTGTVKFSGGGQTDTELFKQQSTINELSPEMFTWIFNSGDMSARTVVITEGTSISLQDAI